MIDTDSDDVDSEIEILRGILSEVQDLNSQLARTDERTKQNSSEVKNLRENRVAPLENDVEINGNRSRRNSIIVGGFVTFITILFGSSAAYMFTLL